MVFWGFEKRLPRKPVRLTHLVFSLRKPVSPPPHFHLWIPRFRKPNPWVFLHSIAATALCAPLLGFPIFCYLVYPFIARRDPLPPLRFVPFAGEFCPSLDESELHSRWIQPRWAPIRLSSRRLVSGWGFCGLDLVQSRAHFVPFVSSRLWLGRAVAWVRVFRPCPQPILAGFHLLLADRWCACSDSLIPSPFGEWVRFLWPWPRSIASPFRPLRELSLVIRPSCGLGSCFPALHATHFGRISPFAGRHVMCLFRSVSWTPICCSSVLSRYCLPLLLAFICCPCSLPLFVICLPILWRDLCCWILPLWLFHIVFLFMQSK